MIKNVWLCINEHRTILPAALGAAKNPPCGECQGMTKHEAQIYVCDYCEKNHEFKPWNPPEGWLQVSLSTEIYVRVTDEIGNKNAGEYQRIPRMPGLYGSTKRALDQPYLLDLCSPACAGSWFRRLAMYLEKEVKSESEVANL